MAVTPTYFYSFNSVSMTRMEFKVAAVWEKETEIQVLDKFESNETEMRLLETFSSNRFHTWQSITSMDTVMKITL